MPNTGSEHLWGRAVITSCKLRLQIGALHPEHYLDLDVKPQLKEDVVRKSTGT